jgi:PAS domain S-box-containing protein
MGGTGKDAYEATGNNRDVRDLSFYRFIIDSLPVGVMTVDSELKITGFNPWAEKITEYSEKEVIGHYCGGILEGGTCGINYRLKTVIKRDKPIIRADTTIHNRWGEIIPVRTNTAGLLDADGRLIGAVEAFQDISI